MSNPCPECNREQYVHAHIDGSTRCGWCGSVWSAVTDTAKPDESIKQGDHYQASLPTKIDTKESKSKPKSTKVKNKMETPNDPLALGK